MKPGAAVKRTRGKAKPRLSFESASQALRDAKHLDGVVICACECGRRATQWHHCLDQSRFPDLADEPDNVIAVASHCHEMHTSAMARFPRSICNRAERLATTEPMKRYLETHYAG